MASKKPKPPSLAALIRQSPTIADLFYSSQPSTIAAMDDRSIAVVQTSHIERELEESITRKLIPLEKPEIEGLFDNGPIGTFSNKIKIAYALGVIGKNTRTELNSIRSIRNVFAHSTVNVRFDTPEIKAECAKLQFVARMSRVHPDFYGATLPWPPRAPREQFFFATMAIQMAFIISRVPDAGHLSEGASDKFPPLD